MSIAVLHQKVSEKADALYGITENICRNCAESYGEGDGEFVLCDMKLSRCWIRRALDFLSDPDVKEAAEA